MASNNQRELTILLKGDATGLIGTMEAAEKEAKKFGVTLDSVSAKAKTAGKAVDDSSKQIEASNKRTAAALGIVAGAAVTAFSALVVHQLNVADATGKMAQRLGVSTEFLSSMGYAAKSTGADSIVLDSALQTLSENQIKVASGNRPMASAFKAMGISIKDANGQLQPMEELLPKIAERFRTMPDGANKAALAARLFGTEGTKLIPMLNQGAEGLAAMTKEAASLGLVLDQQTTDAASNLNDQLDRVKNLTAGAANVFISEMLPAIQAMTGGMGDAKEQADHLSGAAETMATALKGLAGAIYIVVEAAKAIGATVAAAITSMGVALDTIGKNTHTFMDAAKQAVTQTMHLDVKGVFNTWSTAATEMTSNASKGFADMHANANQFVDELKALVKEGKHFWSELFPDEAAKKKAAQDAADAARRAAEERQRAQQASSVASNWDTGKDTAAEQARNLAAVSADYAKLSDIQDTLTGHTDALNKAWSDSAKAIRDIAEVGGDLIKRGQDEAKVQALVSAAIDDATDSRNQAIAAAKRQMDVSGRMIEQIEQQAHLATLSQRDQVVAQAAFEYEQQYRQENLKLTLEQKEAEKERVEQAAASAYDMQKMAEQQNQIAQEYAGYWENAASSISKEFGDLFTGQIHGLKDFANQGKSILQQWVSDILAQFLRLTALGPLLAGSMRSVASYLGITGDLSSSALATADGYYGGGGTIGTVANSMGGSGGGSTSSGYGSYLQTGVAAYRAYSAGGGLFGAGSSAGNIASVGVNSNGVAVAANPWAGTTPYGGTIGSSSIPYAGVAGGLAGAYWGSQRGSGGVSTAASTVTGAVGGYYAAAGAATALSGGIAAGMAAIPVVGWIALAAMLVDQVSGGKLFGTKYQATAADAVLNLGADGGTATQSVTEKRQGALFSGAKWKTTQQAASPELQAAADALFSSVQKTMVQGATQLAVSVPDMINASLSTHSDISKGKVTATSYIVDYLGQTWKEATAEAAAKRIGAEALIAVVQQSAGAGVQQLAQQFRDSADDLADASQAMLEAQSDIVKGNSLVALGAQATLAQVITFTQQLQQDGETLQAAYERLANASAAYLQFVGQFQPTSTGFGASLEAIAKQMQANIDQANALAQAAGLQAAKESDLANIHQYAAQQAADAIAQLSSAAQDLAAKLYDVTGSSLTAVNAQIDKLQSKVQSATQLAIGDNSPLSQKQKLDVALQGLRSGLTSADDVLSLGRQLYASSSDYTDLFNKVQEILNLPTAQGTGAGSITDAISQYTQLTSQRDQLQSQADAQARFGDAKTLAQYVADISTTHGIGYGEAASGLGFNLQDLAKDLGLTNISGYLDSLKLADIPGSTLDASASVVDAIQQLGRDLIQTITGAPITSATIGGSSTATTADPQTVALLASIDQRLAAIEGSSGSTAKSNASMANDSKTDALRQLQVAK